MTRLRRGGLAAAVCALLGGCGLPSHQVTHLSGDSVPFGLLNSGAPTPAEQVAGPMTSVFFVRGERLVAVQRHVVGENVPAEAVRAVLAGPTAAEAASGVSTDVPGQTRLVSLDLIGSVAVCDLSPQFASVGGSDQVLAVAELVWTLTASPSIDAVRFAVNGHRIEVPDDSGTLSSAPRTRRDYRAVAPKG